MRTILYFEQNVNKTIGDMFADWMFLFEMNLFCSENNRCKCFFGVECIFLSCSWLHLQTSLPPSTEALMTWQPTDFCHKHTLGSLKAQKTISITERPSSRRGCREKPKDVSRGGESQLSNKASSICIHRHGYCLQWASPCWQGERWREGKMTTREQSHNEK